MVNENEEDVISQEENNEVVEESGNGEDLSFIKVPKEEYNKTMSTQRGIQ